MQRLHTWSGVALGALLFAIFWTGTLSVFDRWMALVTQLSLPENPLELEALRPLYERAAAAGTVRWVVVLATAREPTARVLARTIRPCLLPARSDHGRRAARSGHLGRDALSVSAPLHACTSRPGGSAAGWWSRPAGRCWRCLSQARSSAERFSSISSPFGSAPSRDD